MNQDEQNYAIIGAGGFGKEVLCLIMDYKKLSREAVAESVVFVVDDQYFKENHILGVSVVKRSLFDPTGLNCLIAIGSPFDRQQLVNSFSKDSINWSSVIHPTTVMSPWVNIGEGAIVTANVILTANISIGKHPHINLATTIGHDCEIGDFFTSAPGVNISGSCRIGDRVYFGSNSCCREKLTICSDVIIGMGAVVLKDITEPGTYVGSPARRIK